MSRKLTSGPTLLHRDLAKLYGEPSELFDVQARAAGLDPGADFVRRDLRDMRFHGADLRGFDFTHSNLLGTQVRLAAAVDDTTVFADAQLDDLDRVWLISRVASRTSLSPDAFWPPAWAHEWGTDRYGAWLSFRVPTDAGTPVFQRMRWAPPGRFQMGSPEGKDVHSYHEGPQHLVTFAQGFWMFDTACTEALWQAVTGRQLYRRRGRDFPTTGVSWDNAQDFIRKVNTLCPGISLTLPSEAQWEYACRASTTTRYSFGNNADSAFARYGSSSPVPVASLPANPWGLFEMHGNVWEWCADPWHGDYTGAPTDGSVWGTDGAAAARVLRGGSWSDEARVVRSAYRYRGDPASRDGNFGFRCARVQVSEKAEAPAGRARVVQLT